MTGVWFGAGVMAAFAVLALLALREARREARAAFGYMLEGQRAAAEIERRLQMMREAVELERYGARDEAMVLFAQAAAPWDGEGVSP